MSSSNHRHQPDNGMRSFELVRDVYLQGAPVFSVPPWVQKRTASYASSDMRRWSNNWRKFYAKTMKEARNERKKILSSTTRPSLYLEPLSPLLADRIREQLELDLPETWDPIEKEKEIHRSLDYVQNGRLSSREQEAIHLGCAIPMGRAAAAKAMDISRDGVKTHVSNAWTKMREDGVDDTAVRWFLTGKVPQNSPRP
ncbi:hypothetical protein [Streptomyces sp. B21-083]|uniref:hypothetical protein n=1 Tax=Streptomyces sp. B21-083 TaxID=3039410 RepID=UPI002FEEC7D0